MIIDKIENRHLYRLPEPLMEALEYFAHHDLSAFDAGKHVLPNGLTMKVDDYIPTEDQRRYEGHEEVTHLRYVVSGSERLGYANKKEMTFVEMVGEDKAIYAGEGGIVRVPKGTFVVLYPQDCHMLKLKDGAGIAVRKASVSLRGKVGL